MNIIFRRILIWVRKPIGEKANSFIHRYYKYRDHFFSRKHSLDFSGNIQAADLGADSAYSIENATAYQPCSLRHFILLVREALSTGIRFENFVDLGCGKGKQCIYARKLFSFKKVVGVDFSASLIEIAKNNVVKTRLKNIVLQNADAVEWLVPNGNSLIFLFNPFNEKILEKFLLNNLNHFKTYQSVIAYDNDVHANTLRDMGFEMMYRNQRFKSSIYGWRSREASQKNS